MMKKIDKTTYCMRYSAVVHLAQFEFQVPVCVIGANHDLKYIGTEYFFQTAFSLDMWFHELDIIYLFGISSMFL